MQRVLHNDWPSSPLAVIVELFHLYVHTWSLP